MQSMKNASLLLLHLKVVDDFLRETLPLSWPSVISPTIGTTSDPLVKKIIYVDPLILDLDGDGLEITPYSALVLQTRLKPYLDTVEVAIELSVDTTSSNESKWSICA
ncbi:hypothetical protein BA022_04730 [Diaphorobacter nitroreducens]|uniref:hypothetical protein n=1 Tax=Diaphorobacter nitroreducens TaxID=164759 RepID=UPI000B59FAD7|nr:hypothetical protein [Diaphorobacter nitroreducens]ASI67943.1 hypothetical protein BA022_04730 [Diaphorobacter nitroreducens]